MPLNKIYLGLGSNLQDRAYYIDSAEKMIEEEIGHIVSSSSLYETQAEGFESDNLFLNKVICLETSLSAFRVLTIIGEIEKRLGRTEKSVKREYKDRTIDIDILFFNRYQIISPTLLVPHPMLHKRRFVLEPLNEIAPKLHHPILNQTIQEIWQHFKEIS